MSTPRQKPEPVYCDECGTQIGEMRRGDLVFFSRHHGERHQTTVQGLTSVQYESPRIIIRGLDKAKDIV